MALGGPKIPKAEPLPTTPRKSDTEVQAEALAQRRQLAARKGSASTILTGGTGDTSTPNTASKTLLGQ